MYARRVAHWLLVLVCGWVAYLTRRFPLDAISRISASTSLHLKCRNSTYPRTDGLQRALVPDELVDWRVSWEEYLPISYTNQEILGMVWADPDIQAHPEIKLRFNEIDGKVDRTSFMGRYRLDSNGLPLNPRGRTGISGRGELGRWGPNHAADPIVTRWKRNRAGERVFDPAAKRFVLQFIAIMRGDCGEWALPGGMVDAGEKCTEAVKREFAEEAMNSCQSGPEELDKIKKLVEEFFTDGTEIYSGYVDDPRNTDNAWMETVAVNYHDEDGDRIANFTLQAGDDAKDVSWMDVSSSLKLYASHRHFVELVAKQRNARW